MVLNILKTMLYVVFPLITFPYISRVLMADNLGKVSFGSSIVNYFALFAALGISTYGVREGAVRRENKNEFSKFSNEVFTVNLVTTLISYLALAVALITVPKLHEYRLLIILQSLSILLTTVGVDWINAVYEDFLYITIRSFLVQVLVLVLLFFVVRSPEDYYNYALLSVLSVGIVSVINFIYTRKYCKVRPVFKCNFRKHFMGMLVFFSNNLAVNIYLNADVTMLGFFDNDYVVGIYGAAVKVYSVIKALIAAAFVASIPRLTSFQAEKRKEEYKELLNHIINICTLIMFPAVAGMIVLAQPIILILSGEGYLRATASLSIISVGIIGAIYGGIITNCVNIPMKREKVNLKAAVIAAIVNIALNMFMIPLFHEKGASVTTVVAEFTVLLYCFFSNPQIKELLHVADLVRNLVVSLVGMLIVFFISSVVKILTLPWLIEMFVIIMTSVTLYILILWITNNRYLITTLSKIKKKR
jgi:O-antigen/teichoic acid export membrane protein